MTSEKEGRADAQPEPKCRHLIPVATAVALMLPLAVTGLALTGLKPAHAAETTLRCLNLASGAAWNLKIDDERKTADSVAADITATRVTWHDIRRGGFYELDRTSGLLTFRNASSTGGYILYYRCGAN
jgi:hypothetical protein